MVVVEKIDFKGETMNEIKIETGADYSLKEYRDWHFFLYYGNGMTGLLNTIGVIAITLITASILTGKAMSGDWHFKFVEIAMMVMEVYMLSIPAVIFYDTKENFASEKYRAENGKLIITPESIEMVSETNNARTTWERIYKVHITKKAIYLEYAKFTAIIIPKRMLKNDDEQKLIQLIREKVKSPGQKAS